ncbi:MAG: universal stress protein [Thermodesulfobacteriota bacterium]|nr:universal stress protein [Thermodesulfobacteriota bacterium]
MADLTKMIVVPMDGSKNELRSLDYLNLIFGPRHNLDVTLFYVLSSLPPIPLEEQGMNRESRLQVKSVEEQNIRMAERILREAKVALVRKGFEKGRVKTLYKRRKVGTARDICMWADDNRADSVLISTRGRSRLQAFLWGKSLGSYWNIVRFARFG